MANAKLIDKINDAFISILVRDKSEAYNEYIRSINREMIDNIDTLDAKKAKQIIRSQKLNIDDVVLLFTIQNAVLLILEDRKRAKRNPDLTPVFILMGMYKLSNPNRFVNKILRISRGKALNDREKEAQALITQFKRDNITVLRDARKQAIRNMQQSILKSKRNKAMLKDFKRLRSQNKSIDQIKNTLVRKYNKLSNVERALDTELHAQSEYVRQQHSIAIGYTHKIWKTQGDERVRQTTWHNGVRNKRVPIESDFRVGGLRAEYPGDDRLPPGERIRCRCYLIYN
jgi:hypothetical protein